MSQLYLSSLIIKSSSYKENVLNEYLILSNQNMSVRVSFWEKSHKDKFKNEGAGMSWTSRAYTVSLRADLEKFYRKTGLLE